MRRVGHLTALLGSVLLIPFLLPATSTRARSPSILAIPHAPQVEACPASAPKGSYFSFLGSGFTPRERISLYLELPGREQAPVTPFDAYDDGSFFVYTGLPQSWPGGWVTLRAYGDDSGGPYTAQFHLESSPAPAALVEVCPPARSPDNLLFSASGIGYTPDEDIDHWLNEPDGTRWDLESAQTDGDGAYYDRFRLNGPWPAGTYTYTAEGRLSGRQATTTFEVQGPAATATLTVTASPSATLPPTATQTPGPTSTPTATRQHTVTAAPSRTPTPTATQTDEVPEGQREFLPLVRRSVYIAPPTSTSTQMPPTPTPTVDATAPPSAIEYRGTTNQERLIELSVKLNRSAVTQAKLNYRVSCDGITQTSTVELSSPNGWAIENRTFAVEADCAFDLTGVFAEDFTSVSGTWQGIICSASGFPREEICRGPVSTWSASQLP